MTIRVCLNDVGVSCTMNCTQLIARVGESRHRLSIFDVVSYQYRAPTLRLKRRPSTKDAAATIYLISGIGSRQLYQKFRSAVSHFLVTMRMGDLELPDPSPTCLCPICLEAPCALPASDWWVSLLCCENTMHAKCLMPILLRAMPCPLCRSKRCAFCAEDTPCLPIPGLPKEIAPRALPGRRREPADPPGLVAAWRAIP